MTWTTTKTQKAQKTNLVYKETSPIIAGRLPDFLWRGDDYL
jgi:hypothetical protein